MQLIKCSVDDFEITVSPDNNFHILQHGSQKYQMNTILKFYIWCQLTKRAQMNVHAAYH